MANYLFILGVVISKVYIAREGGWSKSKIGLVGFKILGPIVPPLALSV